MSGAFTQPMCDDCWIEREGDRLPTRLTPDYREEERCCYCGTITVSGIYTRVDPATVPYPTYDEQ